MAKARKAKAQSGEKMKFRVLRGAHIDEEGQVKRKGEIVESSTDLAKRFKDEKRFKRVVEVESQADDDEEEEVEEIEVTAASKKAAQKNPKGAHDRSMTIPDDEEEEEDDDDEDEEEEDDEEEAVTAGLQSAEADEDEEEDEEESDEEEDEEDDAEDVTSDFKKEAKAAGATVSKTGRTYSIADKKGNVIGKKGGYTRKDDVLKALKKAAK